MAQLIVSAAGAAIGFAIGGPTGAQIGWALGSVLGAGMGPTQRSQGPRLTDLKITGTEYGQPIPWLKGHPRVSGQVWWSSERREIATTTEVGGKGAPSQEYTSYTYDVDMLIGLSDNEIAGVSRIWSNGKLVWNTLDSAASDSVAASVNTDLWRRVTVYTGEAGQMPDPTYEAAVGTANAPAYRGRGSIFIEGLQLGASGQVPNLTFEVVTTGTQSTAYDYVPEIYSVDVFTSQYPWSIGHRIGSYPVCVTNIGDLLVKRWSVVEQADGTASISYAGTPFSITAAGGPVAGKTDETCLVLSNGGGTNIVRIFEHTGSSADYSVGSTVAVFGRRNDVTVVRTGTNAIVKLPANVTASGTYAVSDIAVGTNKVFALRTTASPFVVYVFDLSTMALIDTITSPGGLVADDIVCDEDDTLYSIKGLALHRRDGASWTALPNLPNSGWGTVGGYGALSLSNDGYLYQTSAGTAGVPFTAKRLLFLPIWTLANDTLASVVSALCLRAGMSAAQFDVTGLSGITKPVRALAVSQVGGTRAVLEMLAAAYFFECGLSDKLYFRARGGASVATIPYADLGASTQPAGEAEPLELKLNNELEIPAQIAVSYSNVDTDYNTDTQNSDRLLTAQGSTSALQIPLGFTAAEAKGIADAIVADQAASVVSTTIALLPKWARLEPTDVVDVIDEDGSSYRLRLVKRSDASGLLKFDAVLDDASVLTSAGITSGDYTSTSVVNTPADSAIELLDLPILRDADDAPGFYVAAKGLSTPWPGTALYGSANDVDFAQLVVVSEAGVTGTATTTLQGWSGGWVVDESNALTVDVGDGTLSSSTIDAMLVDQTINAMLVGSEIIRFVTATLVSPGVYTIKRLLRGQRGTEWAMAGHVAAERVVLLRNAGMRRVATQANEIGQARFYKGVTLGRKLSSAISEAFTDTGVALKPFSPVDLRASRAVLSGDITFTWSRRTRLASNFCGPAGISAPLDEASERYEIEIYGSGAYSSPIRTLSASAETCVYLGTQQEEDATSLLSTLYVMVYQISDSGVRGYALQTSVGTPIAPSSGAFLPTSNKLRILPEFAGDLLAVDVGQTSAGGRWRLYRSTNNGASWTVGYEGAVQPAGVSGALYFDSSIAGTRLALSFNGYASINYGSTATSNTAASTPYDPLPVLGGGVAITPGALYSDGTTFSVVGRRTDGSQVFENMYLYTSTDGVTWSEAGPLTPDGSDPNVIDIRQFGSFNATWFVPNSFGWNSLQSSLKKFGSRWFMSGQLSAYYTDDVSPVANWKRAPMNLGETDTNPPTAIGDVSAFSTFVIAMRRNSSGNCISYSSDNGSTWTAIRPAPLLTGETLDRAWIQGGYYYAYVSSSGVVIRCTDPSSTWTRHSTTGLNFMATPHVSGSNVVCIDEGRMKYSANGIDWQSVTGIDI